MKLLRKTFLHNLKWYWSVVKLAHRVRSLDSTSYTILHGIDLDDFEWAVELRNRNRDAWDTPNQYVKASFAGFMDSSQNPRAMILLAVPEAKFMEIERNYVDGTSR